MSQNLDILTQAMEPNMASIYLILAENGEMVVPELVKKTKLSRTIIYEALAELLAKGFLEYRKERRNAYYKIKHPGKIMDLAEEKKREANLFGDELSNVVKNLTGVYNLNNHKPGVRFFEGDEGIKIVTFDSLQAKGEILTFVDVDATQKNISEINKEYVAKRLKLGIKKRQIAPDTAATRARYQNYSPLLEVKLMPLTIKPFKTIVQIYNQTVSFTTLNEQKKIGVLIEDEDISQFLRSLFEFVWNTLPALNG